MSDAKVKDRIKQVAQDLLLRYGIRSTSMDDIAAKLGISKKTIYQFYKDKDEVVEEVISALICSNQETCKSDRQRAESAIHEIFIAMDMVTEIFRSMNPSVLFDLQKYHPAAFARFLNHKNEFLLSMMQQNLVRGIAEELYRKEININVMSRYRVESMFIPFNQEFVKNAKVSLVDIEQELIVHYLYGLVSTKGYKMVLKYLDKRERLQQTQKNNNQ